MNENRKRFSKNEISFNPLKLTMIKSDTNMPLRNKKYFMTVPSSTLPMNCQRDEIKKKRERFNVYWDNERNHNHQSI